MQRLRKRQEFLRVRDGRKANAATLTLQARARAQAAVAPQEALPRETLPQETLLGPPLAGFTVTKKIGGAVERNRIRRRLREAIRLIGALHAREGHDYVVVGRRAALEAPFATILNDLTAAFGRVHADRQGGRGARRPADEAAR